jgi:hypothetical protein
VELVNVTIDGEIDNLTINGVDVAPLVNAELDRRFPDRAERTACGTIPTGLLHEAERRLRREPAMHRLTRLDRRICSTLTAT